MNETLKLPLWKNVVELMLGDDPEWKAEHAKVYSADMLERELRTTRDTMQFGMEIFQIRKALEMRGYYLSGRGQNGNQFVIIPPENNRNVLKNNAAEALELLRRGMALGMATRTELLSNEDKRRHESMLEKVAAKYALLRRSGQITKLIKKHKPNLLNGATQNEAEVGEPVILP